MFCFKTEQLTVTICSIPRVVKLWRENLSKVNQKAAESLADPTEYENLFPGLKEAFAAEEFLKQTHSDLRPASEYPLVTVSSWRNPCEIWPAMRNLDCCAVYSKFVFACITLSLFSVAK